MVRVAEQPHPVPHADGADQQVPWQVGQHVQQLVGGMGGKKVGEEVRGKETG